MSDPRILYLDLMKKVLTHYIIAEPVRPITVDLSSGRGPIKKIAVEMAAKFLAKFNLQLGIPHQFDKEQRRLGRDWPLNADTLIGITGLDNLQFCIQSVLENNVKGDLIEAGVWRGGSSIFMKACLKAYNVNDRKVWLADSFEGLPKPNPDKYPVDAGDQHYRWKYLSVSLDQVQENFRKYNLLDENVKFLKGWFKDTLPVSPVQEWSIVRIDGDMYESTIDALENLYPKLSIGGFLIIDDFNLPRCRRAVHDFRNKNGIDDEMIDVDGFRIYWKKLK